MPARLLIADDHAAIRDGIAKLVEHSDLQVVASAESVQEAIEQTFRFIPDLLITDVRFPDGDGIELISSVRERLPTLPIMVLSAYDNPTYTARLSLLNITDYVLKGVGTEDILQSIERGLRQQPPQSTSPLARIREMMSRRRPETIEDFPLTQREMQVLRHVALGLSNREIGHSLRISIETVKEHVQNILRKIDATDRTQAAVWAVKRGLLKTQEVMS